MVARSSKRAIFTFAIAAFDKRHLPSDLVDELGQQIGNFL